MMIRVPLLLGVVGAAMLACQPTLGQKLVTLRGAIVDDTTNTAIPARLYIHSDKGTWHFARTDVKEGAAIIYDKRRGASIEAHTTLSAHPFQTQLPAGRYTIVVERGKEYFPLQKQLDLNNPDQVYQETFRLKRWIDMSSEKWFSGETHVHRSLEELPHLARAEDLNVSFPLTYWVTQSHTSPTQGNDAKLAKKQGPIPNTVIQVDPTHVIYPMNTEFEIFRVRGQQHTLGAVFALNHKRPFAQGVPPVKPIAEQTHQEGGLLELDKHNWPWSLMLVPVMKVDLYELTNNHLWRTDFHFRKFGEAPPAFMKVEQNAEGMTERGWLDYTWNTYYLLLNCGFRLRPTAGTASGVHPVPLGYGRVYVNLPDGFSYAKWLAGLNQGRSFVTTGPMVTARVNGQAHGHGFQQQDVAATPYRVQGRVRSQLPLESIEIVVGGQVHTRLTPNNKLTHGKDGGYQSSFDLSLDLDSSNWIVVRCFEKVPGGRLRFAHTSPWFIDVTNRPLHPRPEQVQYLVQRMREELQRNQKLLSKESLEEYRQAILAYQASLKP